MPWLEVKKSSIDGAGIGVFALREFHPGSHVGVYWGEKVSRSAKSSDYQLCAVDTKGGMGNPLCLGMHMINDLSIGLSNFKEKIIHVRLPLHRHETYQGGARTSSLIQPFLIYF